MKDELLATNQKAGCSKGKALKEVVRELIDNFYGSKRVRFVAQTEREELAAKLGDSEETERYEFPAKVT